MSYSECKKLREQLPNEIETLKDMVVEAYSLMSKEILKEFEIKIGLKQPKTKVIQGTTGILKRP